MAYSDKEVKKLFPFYKKEKQGNKPMFFATRKLYNSLIDEINKVLPVNPRTGHADNFITRFFQSVSQEEKELIANFLIEKPVYNSPKQLTDDDLISLLPSRYLQEPAELDRYRDAMFAYIQKNQIQNSASSAQISTSSVSVSSDASSES